MAIQEPLMVESVEGNTDLELEADTGESLLVKDIMVDTPATNYAELTVGKTTVGYWRVGGTQGNHLPYLLDNSEKTTLYKYLLDNDLIRGIPVAEGQTLAISGVAQANARQAVIYELGEAGDYTPDMPNGSASEDYDVILYGDVSGGAGSGENLYNVMVNPAEFIDFPFESDVPATKAVTILGMAVADVGKTSGTQANQQGTEYVKWISGRETYFDKAKEGLPLEGDVSTTSDVTNVGDGQSVIGVYSDIDRALPLIFPEPYSFGSGEELNTYIDTVLDSGAANFAEGDAEIALIARVTPV